MKKLTLIISLLVAMVTTAMSQSVVLVEKASLMAQRNSSDQYEWTSGTLNAPNGEFKKLRITFLKNNSRSFNEGYPFVTIAEFYLYDAEGNRVTLTSDKFSSNATQQGEGKIEALCDDVTVGESNKYDWYWHSMYSGTPNPNSYHYLEIDLTDVTADLSNYKIGWVSRNSAAVPAEVCITAGASSDEARKMVYACTMMPALTTNESVPILYTIKNVRHGSIYAKYAGDNATMALSAEKSKESYFYFTGSIENGIATVKIHNLAANGKLCAAYNSWTDEGIDWYIQPQATGMSISNNKDCSADNTSWNNARNENELVEYWNGPDVGSAWIFERVYIVNPELEQKVISSVGTAATTIDEDQWYVLNNVGRGNYVSQEGTEWKMRGTDNLLAEDVAANKAGYLFRIVKAADNVHYNAISGNGMSFALYHNVAETSSKPVDFDIALIENSTDNFYIYDANNGYTADGQATDQNFVGWSESVPTTAGGYDSYRLLPIELSVVENIYQVELIDLIAEIEAANITGGVNPGEYNETIVASLNEAVAAAKTVKDATATDVEALRNAYESLVINPIEEGLYRIVNAKPAFNNEKVLTAYGVCGWYGTASTPAWTQIDDNDPLQYFTIEVDGDNYYVKAADDNYITSAGTLGSEPVAATFTWVAAGQYNITVAGDVFHANLHGYGVSTSNIISYGNGADNPSAWKLFAVNETPSFSHTLNVTEAGWSTLVLGFNATIPTAEDFKAYTVSSIEDGYVALEEATGVLKANTAIIVNAPKGKYEFAYSADEATVTESLLDGSLYNKNITPEGTAYVLGNVNNNVGLYKATINVSTDTTNDGTEEAPAVTYEGFLNNANKAYLVVPGASEAASYSFRFGEGTTGVDQITENRVQSTVIYDLTGRRVENPSNGIYVVNGKKVLVK